MKIKVYESTLGQEELDNVIECIKSNAISGTYGRFITEFEQKFAEYCGCKYGISTTSGTTALHLALASLDLGRRDEVITTTITNAATVFSIIYCDATPVLVDIEPDTWNIDIEKIEEKINERTKAILPVHIYGHPVDMDPIIELAEKYNLKIVEDCAECHGGEYKGKKVGSFGDIGCFSMYFNKVIQCGEGGMLTTNNENIAEYAKLLRNLAFSKERRFLHNHIGYNYRMSNLHASIAVAQLKKIDKIIERKREIAQIYNSLLKDADGITLPVEKPYAKNVYWMYCILVEKNRDELMEKLAKEGIETRTFFIPMHQQPAFHNMGLFKKDAVHSILSKSETYPVAEEISEKGMYLPSGLNLTKEQIESICDVIKKC